MPTIQSHLDSIRINEGIERCKAVFGDICETDIAKAPALVNDPSLTYPSLFILLPQIESYRLYRFLSPVKKAAVSITAHVLGRAGGAVLRDRNRLEYAALKWMLETGHTEDGLSDDYEQVLDITVSVLINLYKDKSVLPTVADMIFRRGLGERNIHDLVWAYFRIADPEALKLVAQHLPSTDPAESELACNLLGIEADSRGTGEQKEAFLHWLSDNDPFLYFTDESYQQTSNPAFYRVDQERKYVQKGTPAYTKQPVVAMNENESRHLAAFKQLGDDEKQLLSEYSHQIHGDRSKWQAWMAQSVDEQIQAAAMSRRDVWL